MSNNLEYKFFAVFSVISVFAYLSWYSYSTQVMTVDPNSLPVIRAKKEIKFKPENPGGIEIANLDKGIYDYISGRESINKKVSASYSREEAMSREQIHRSLGNTQKFVNTTKVKEEVVDAKYYLRVAKLKSAEVYDKALEIVLNKHKDTLKRLRASLYNEKKSGDSAYYMHFGPTSSKKEAEDICKKIIANKGQCKVFM